MWTFVSSAESAVLLQPEVMRAFTVPRTGPGVGEQQCFVTRDSKGRESTSFIEVTATEPGVFAEYQGIEHTEPKTTTRVQVAAVDGGTRLTMTAKVVVPGADPKSARDAEREFEQHARRYCERVQAVLRSGVVPLPAEP